MKILIEIQDNKANFFLELLKSFKFIKSQKVIDEEEYDPEFVKKIKESQKEIKEGKVTRVEKDNFADFLGLE